MKNVEEELKEKFLEYANSYDMNNWYIKLKYLHSLKVKEFARQIAISEELSEHEIEVATVIGLLHDYGRFKQWIAYGEDADIKTIDHGDLGAELLFDNKEIYNFYKNESDFDIIKTAIKSHNKFSIPNNLNEREIIMCKIIRDADKLDLFNLYINDKLIFKESEEEITEKVKKDFYEMKLINYKDVKNDNDTIILYIAQFFDINFKFSVNYIIEEKILNKLYENIDNKERFKEYFDFIEKKLKN